MSVDWWAPLLTGLVGSLHCLGMCGPIAVSLPLKERTAGTRLFSGLIYNSGRTLMYGLVGLLLGTAGLGLHFWGVQQWASIAAGAVMILSVAFPLVVSRPALPGKLDRALSSYRQRFGALFAMRTYRALFLIGLLNGLLPCGLVYVALAGAVLTPDPLSGAVYMMIFGAGTVPALLAAGMAGSLAGMSFRTRLRSVIPYLVLFIGTLFVLRGMNLGIPYLSPKMEPPKQKTEVFQKPECCH